jgi:para-nitrobenzyl esterase
MYRFEFLSESAKRNGMLVSHAFELPCVFASREHPFSKMLFEGESQEVCDRIVNDVHVPWTTFIKTGEPDRENWPVFGGSNGEVRIYDRKTNTQRIDRTELRLVWNDMRFYED